MLPSLINTEVKRLQIQGLLRKFRVISSVQGVRVRINGRWYLSFASNDYLGLTQHPALKRALNTATQAYGAGSGASRLMAGTFTPHEQLERALARFKHKPDAILFTSGYAANLGVITTLVRKDDLIFCDELNHASLVDAARLTKAKIYIYKHRDVKDLEKELQHYNIPTFKHCNRFILTDTIFSMDGDAAPLIGIVKLAKRYNATTIIDEAHGTGVLGKNGHGLAEAVGVEKSVDIIIGTLSKALGTMGGFVTGSSRLISYIRSKARPFIFTTALPPGVAQASIIALKILATQPRLRQHLWDNTHYVKDRLIKLGFDLRGSETPIIPVMIGDNKKALRVSQYLWSKGLFIPAIRPPTVPTGTARLRLTITALHTRPDLDYLITHLSKALTPPPPVPTKSGTGGRSSQVTYF